MTEIPRQDPELIKALAREAGDLLANRAFDTAVKTLRHQWRGELLNSNLTTEQVLELVAKLRALEAIPQMLKHLMTTQEMAQRHVRRN